MIPRNKDNPKGLHQKYVIRKIVGTRKSMFGWFEYFRTKKVDPESEYFVLRLDNGAKDPNHLWACRKAIHTYAKEIESHLPELAKDLRQRYPLPFPNYK